MMEVILLRLYLLSIIGAILVINRYKTKTFVRFVFFVLAAILIIGLTYTIKSSIIGFAPFLYLGLLWLLITGSIFVLIKPLNLVITISIIIVSLVVIFIAGRSIVIAVDHFIWQKKLNRPVSLAIPLSDAHIRLLRYVHDGKIGYKNMQGELIIPTKYDYGLDFSFGFAAIKIKDKWGFINTKGELVIPAIYGSAGSFNANGLAKVSVSRRFGRYNNWSYVNDRGHWTVSLFDNIWNFSDTRQYNWEYIAVFENKSALVEGIPIVVHEEYKRDRISAPVLPDIIATDKLTAFEQNGKWGFTDSKGNITIPARFDNTTDFENNGLTTVKIGKKWGFINIDGDIVIPAKFDSVENFADNGLAKAELNGLYGFINLKGELVIDAKYYSAGDFTPNGLAVVSTSKDGWGYINLKGKLVLKNYNEAKSFNEKGEAKVCKYQRFSIWDPSYVCVYIDGQGDLIRYVDPG